MVPFGYVSCAQELLQQSFDMGVNFDHIICPSGSTGTHAGVLSGILGNNANIPVTGISVNRKKEIQTDAVFNLTQRTMDLLDCENKPTKDKVVVFDDYVGPGYSLPTQSMVDAVQLLARTEAILIIQCIQAKLWLVSLIRSEKDTFEGCKMFCSCILVVLLHCLLMKTLFSTV